MSEPRQARIEALVEDYLDGLQAGDRPDREAILSAHPDLAVELDRRLRLVEAMQRLAHPRPDGVAPPGFDERSIRLCCPQCGSPVQLVVPEAPDATYRNCGSSFPVAPAATAPYRPDLLPRTLG